MLSSWYLQQLFERPGLWESDFKLSPCRQDAWFSLIKREPWWTSSTTVLPGFYFCKLSFNLNSLEFLSICNSQRVSSWRLSPPDLAEESSQTARILAPFPLPAPDLDFLLSWFWAASRCCSSSFSSSSRQDAIFWGRLWLGPPFFQCGWGQFSLLRHSPRSKLKPRF